MSECVKCGQYPRNKLTNNRIRRSEGACSKVYNFPPDQFPFLDLAAYPELAQYVRHKGALVGQDPATGYLKGAWQYTDAATFAAEYVGVLDYSLEPADADCNPKYRKCGGSAVVYSGCNALAEAALVAPAATLGTGEAVKPVLGTNGYVEPFYVELAGATDDPDAIGSVYKAAPGSTLESVTFASR